jgi:hypothetical protein
MSFSPIPAVENANIASITRLPIATTLKRTTLDFKGMMGRSPFPRKMVLCPRISLDRVAFQSMPL